jgi:hypothetical protein
LRENARRPARAAASCGERFAGGACSLSLQEWLMKIVGIAATVPVASDSGNDSNAAREDFVILVTA